MSPRLSGGIAWMLVLMAALAVAASALSLGICPQDDAFISFRYARHLVDGHGLTWNPDERPVEGYTNFLWTLGAAGALRLGLDPMQAARWAGLASAVALVLLTGLYGRRLAGLDGAAGAVPPLLLVGSSALAAEAIQGLETVFFALLVLGALYRHARETEGEGRRGLPWSGLLCGLAALTRPEGIGIFGILLLHRLALGLLGARRLGKADLFFTGLFLVPVVSHLAFRMSYYGYPLPNTFYAKVGLSGAQIARGFTYLWACMVAVPLLFLAPAAGALDHRRRTWWWSLVAICIGYLGEVVLVGGDFKPTFRVCIPVFAPLALLTGVGLAALARRAGDRRDRRLAWTVVALAVVVSGAWLWHRTAINRMAARNMAVTHEISQLAGAYLARNHPGATLAIGTAGMIPYFSGLPTVDMWGLNDLHIARTPALPVGKGESGHEKGDGRYVVQERRPSLILFKQSTRSARPLTRDEALAAGLWRGSEAQVAALPEFARDYRLRSVPLAGFYLNYFERIHP